MDGLENVIRSEIYQEKTNTVCITYMWDLKNNTMNVYAKQKQTHRHRERAFGYKGRRGGMDWELEIITCKLLHIK